MDLDKLQVEIRRLEKSISAYRVWRRRDRGLSERRLREIDDAIRRLEAELAQLRLSFERRPSSKK